jgi:hypothetical protein
MKNLTTAAPLALLVSLALTACPSDDGGDEVGDTTGDTTGDPTTDTGTTDATDTGTTDPTDTGTTDTGTTDDPTGGETAMVRLMHLGVFPNDENTSVDIFANGAPTGVSFEFKQGTPYVELPAGTYTFDVVPSGGTIDDSVFTVPDFALAAGDMWSIYAAGYVAPEGDDAPFGVGAFMANVDGIPAGNVRLNVIHAAPLAAFDPVDVWLVDGECAPVAPILEGFAFGDAALDLDVPAGPIGVGLDVGQDATVDACFAVPDLGADIVVDVYAVNDSQGAPSLIAHLPDGAVAEVQPQ